MSKELLFRLHFYYCNSFSSFSHQRLPMVPHWSLSNSKSPHVFRTLLSILHDLSNVVVWVVSTHPDISNSSSHCINPLVIVPRAPITICITVTFMFHSFFFQFPSKVPVFILLSFFFHFYSVVSRDSEDENLASPFFFFFCCWLQGLSSSWDKVIRLYRKIPEEFVRLILQDRFRVVHITFVHMVKLQFLAKFANDHLAHPIVCSLILFLYCFHYYYYYYYYYL